MGKMNKEFNSDFSINEDININVKNIFNENGEEIPLAMDIEMKLIKLAPNGGVIETFFNLEEKMSFCFELLIPRTKILPVAEILEKKETKDEYLYTCKFVKLPYDDEAKIKRYIFENQLKTRKGDSYNE